jgi:hypothetical protein
VFILISATSQPDNVPLELARDCGLVDDRPELEEIAEVPQENG